MDEPGSVINRRTGTTAGLPCGIPGFLHLTTVICIGLQAMMIASFRALSQACPLLHAMEICEELEVIWLEVVLVGRSSFRSLRTQDHPGTLKMVLLVRSLIPNTF